MADFSTSIDIAAPADVVFAHLVTVDGMLAWLGQHAELEATPGGGFAVDIDGSPIRGSFLLVEPPHRVVVSWGMAGSEDFPPGSSRVEFTLTAHDGGTRLDLVHSGLPEPRAPRYATGWDHFLGRLRTTAAGADARETFDELAAEHLRSSDVSLCRALQSEVLKVHGKIFAFLKLDRLVVKLPAVRAAGLVATGEAVPFESGGRPTREWVAVASTGELGRWRELMDEARAFVGR